MLLAYFVNLNYQNKKVFISLKKEIRLKNTLYLPIRNVLYVLKLHNF